MHILIVLLFRSSWSGDPFLSHVISGSGLPPSDRHARRILSPIRRYGSRSPSISGAEGGSEKRRKYVLKCILLLYEKLYFHNRCKWHFSYVPFCLHFILAYNVGYFRESLPNLNMFKNQIIGCINLWGSNPVLELIL